MLKVGLAISLLLALLSACSVTEYKHASVANTDSPDAHSGDSGVSANSPSSTAGTSTLAGKVLWNDSPSLSAGMINSCALTATGDVMCWGGTHRGTYAGEMGNNQHVPTKVEGVSNAVQVSTGDNYSCAVTEGGNVACWTHKGSATYIQEGSDRLANIVQVSTHIYGDYACALTTRGSVKCWWSKDISYNGELIQRAARPLDVLDQDGNVLRGIAQVLARGQSTQAGYQSSAIAIQSGEDDPVGIQAHHCFLTAAGGVRCWHSTFLSPDRPPKYFHDDIPSVYWADFYNGVVHTDGSPLTNIVQISAGEAHFCGIMSLATGSKVMCWGQNFYLGDGDRSGLSYGAFSKAVEVITDNSTPLGGIVSITAGMSSTCAINKDGAAWCWGNNAKKISSPPTGFASLAEGDEHSCGLAKSTGTTSSVYCWGENRYGQLGIDPNSGSVPTQFDASRPVSGLVVPHRRAKFGCNSTACVLKVGQ